MIRLSRLLTLQVVVFGIIALLGLAVFVMAITDTGPFGPTGAGSNATPSPTASVDPTPTPTPEPTAEPTAEPTPAPTPTSTPAPSDDQTGGKPLGTESTGCLDGLPFMPDHNPAAQPGDYTVPCDGMYRAINYWNPKVPEYNRGAGHTNALLVCFDQQVVLHNGGGSQYQWTHYGTALGNYQKSVNPTFNPMVKLSDLVAQNLATVTVKGGGQSVCDNPNSGSGSSGSSNNPPSGDNGAPPPQVGCTTTNKQTTPDELVAVGSFKPLNILHRIDAFGYSGWSLSEFYTLVADKSEQGAHRVPTIGYVGQPRETLDGLVGIWFGAGSFWDYGDNNATCNKDYALSWAKYYAVSGAIQPGRLDNGNSGVVVDMQSCKLYNHRPDLGWNHGNIQALLSDHLANMATFPCMSLTDSADGSTYEVTPGAQDLRGSDQTLPTGPNAGQQCGMVDSVNTGGLLPRWTIRTTADQVAVVNYWNNMANPNPYYKFLLKPGSSITLVGGGDATFFPATCEKSDVVQNGLHALDKSKGQKLVSVGDIPSRYKK